MFPLCAALCLISQLFPGSASVEPILEDLNPLIREYKDSEVMLIILWPELILAEPPFPLLVSNSSYLPKNHPHPLLWRGNQRKRFFNSAIFILIPEARYRHWYHLNRDFQFPKVPEIAISPKLYVNVLTTQPKFQVQTSLTTGPLKELLSVYYLNKRGRNNFYGVGDVMAAMRIPPYKPNQNHLNPVWLVPVVPRCVHVRRAICRPKIEARLNLVGHGGNFFIDSIKKPSTLKMAYTTGVFNDTSFLTIHEVVRRRYGNSPFKSYPHRQRQVLHFLALEAFQGWVDVKTHKFETEYLDGDFYFAGFVPEHISYNSFLWAMFRLGMNDVMKDPSFRRSILRDKTGLYLLPTSTDWINFITCDGVSQGTSFKFYVAPYDLASWAAIISFIFPILPSAVWTLYRFRSTPGIPWRDQLNLLLDAIFFHISLTLEIGHSLPGLLKKIPGALQSAEFICSVWVVMMVILVNAYKGIVTTDLTAQIPVEQSYFRLSEMRGFTFLASKDFLERIPEMHKKYEMIGFEASLVHLTNLRACICFADIEKIVPLLCEASKYAYSGPRPPCSGGRYSKCSLKDSCDRVREKLDSLAVALQTQPAPPLCHFPDGNGHIQTQVRHFRESGTTLQNLMLRDFNCGHNAIYGITQKIKNKTSIAILPFDKAVVMEIVESSADGDNLGRLKNIIDMLKRCEKISYVGHEQTLDGVMLLAETSLNLKLRKGEDRLNAIWKAELIENNYPSIHIIYRRMLELMANGVYHIWRKWYDIHHPPDDELARLEFFKNPPTRVKKLNLQSNVHTAFYIYSFTITLALISFCIEKMAEVQTYLADLTHFYLVLYLRT